MRTDRRESFLSKSCAGRARHARTQRCDGNASPIDLMMAPARFHSFRRFDKQILQQQCEKGPVQQAAPRRRGAGIVIAGRRRHDAAESPTTPVTSGSTEKQHAERDADGTADRLEPWCPTEPSVWNQRK